jgi:predicted ArsR family transcriptional regulator
MPHSTRVASVHPTRVRMIHLMSDGKPWSPVELSRELGVTLGAVAYHVRTMAADDRLRLVDERRVRGAVEHVYRLNVRAVDGPERLAVLALRAADTLDELAGLHPDGGRAVRRLVRELRKANPIESR